MMRKRSGFGVCMGLSMLGLVLAGCQEGSKFKIREHRGPAELGLQVEVLGDFGRDGILASEPSNLGRSYLEQGELRFRVLRVTNQTGENREIHPSVSSSGDSVLELLTQYMSLIPRTMPINSSTGVLTRGDVSKEDLTDEYRAKFQFQGANFVFDTGGSEAIGENGTTGFPKGIRIRGGESAVLSVRLGLKSNNHLLASANYPHTHIQGTVYYPPDRFLSPEAGGEVLVGDLLGAFVELNLRLDIFGLDPETGALHPLDLPEVSRSFRLFDRIPKNLGIPFPLKGVSGSWVGLPIQI